MTYMYIYKEGVKLIALSRAVVKGLNEYSSYAVSIAKFGWWRSRSRKTEGEGKQRVYMYGIKHRLNVGRFAMKNRRHRRSKGRRVGKAFFK
jgi:hypothetical protein